MWILLKPRSVCPNLCLSCNFLTILLFARCLGQRSCDVFHTWNKSALWNDWQSWLFFIVRTLCFMSALSHFSVTMCIRFGLVKHVTCVAPIFEGTPPYQVTLILQHFALYMCIFDCRFDYVLFELLSSCALCCASSLVGSLLGCFESRRRMLQSRPTYLRWFVCLSQYSCLISWFCLI